MQTQERTTPALANGRCVVVNEDHQVEIPNWVVDLESFRRWGDSDDFPEEGRIWYLKGQVWIDMSWEQVFSHNQVKAEYYAVLGNLARVDHLGRYFPDGLRLTSVEADYSGVPDFTFVLASRWRRGLVRLVPGKTGGFIELEGTPDMVLEIVSRSSVLKDTEILRESYWQAGIPEYWLVDARRELLLFDILRHTAKGYVATRKQAGWLKSTVFGKSFKLTQHLDDAGHPQFTLAVR